MSRSDRTPHGTAAEAWETVKTVVSVLLIVLVLRIFLFQPFTIPSASMQPTLYEGDYIIVSKFSYGWSRHSVPFSPPIFHGRLMNRAPQRGDVVVFKTPKDNRTDLIKRVIGLPGDRIQVRGSRLYINGRQVPHELLGFTTEDEGDGYPQRVARVREVLPGGKTIVTDDFGPGMDLDDTDVFVVPEGRYFMMGDNRDNSLDSRVAPENGGVGFVPAENLVGKAQIVLISWQPGASLFKPWTWPRLRPGRLFKPLH